MLINLKIYRFAIVFLFLLAMVNDAFSQRIQRLNIPSNTPWTDTGIDVTEGSKLHIEARGEVIYWDVNNAKADPNGINWDGTRFFSNAILPNAVVVSLIGKIGGTTQLGTGTPLAAVNPANGDGFVGKTYKKNVAQSGRLFLGFNDTPNAFGDNIGSFQVLITVTKSLRHEVVAIEHIIQSKPAITISKNVFSDQVFKTNSQQISVAQISTNIPQSINIGIYAGIEIHDYANQLCGIQFCTDFSATNQWQGLTNIVPDSTNFIWFDTSKPASLGQRFYRVVPGPIEVP